MLLPDFPTTTWRGTEDEITTQAVIVERILTHLDSGWRDDLVEEEGYLHQWDGLRTLALRAAAAVESAEEIRANLGDNAPQLGASAFHPWAWEGAKSLWQSGHYREAVTAAARKINAEAQNKLSRRDLSEVKLFQEALSTKTPPTPERPQLRIVQDDGGETYKNIQRGVMAFAEGCYAAIRNPNSHEVDLPDLAEHEALEQLAAFSQLARWIDGATVVTSP